MTTRNVIFAGIDDGNRETKITLSNGIDISIHSRAMSGSSGKISLNGSTAKAFSYETESGVFTVGDIEVSEDTAYDGYPTSAQNRAIVAHALRMSGLDGNWDIHAVSGLPLKRFYVNGKPNIDLIRKKRSNLMMRDVLGTCGYVPPVLLSHDVMSEAVAAWVNFILTRNDDGQLVINHDRVAQRSAVVDIGGRTLDIAVIKSWDLDLSRSTTDEIGMINVVEGLKEALFDRFDGVEPTDEQLDNAIMHNRVKMWGDWVDVADIVRSARLEVVNSIKATVMRRLRKTHDIDQVFFVGGTSKYLADELEGWFPNQIMVENPGYANSSGMCKYAEFVESNRKKG